MVEQSLFSGRGKRTFIEKYFLLLDAVYVRRRCQGRTGDFMYARHFASGLPHVILFGFTMAGLFPRCFSFRQRGWRGPWLALVALPYLMLGGCMNTNSGLALPRAGGPIPVSAPHEQTAAERAYWDQLAPARVIYIGETHNSNFDHEYQLDVLKGLKARGAQFTLAWEMFDLTQQPVLDNWQARRLSTDTLLEKTDFQRHWGTYSVMYEKILRWSQSEGVACLALNAPPGLSHKLAQGQALDSQDASLVPTGYHPLPGGYEHFAEQMAQNPHGGANLENFYKAQLLWDQTMAMRIVDFLAAHPNEKLVVLIGRGHVEGGFGVPSFVGQKTDAPQIVVYPGGPPPETKRPGGAIARNEPFSFDADLPL